MSKEFIERKTEDIKFELKRGQTLAINLNSDLGVDRVLIRHEKGKTVEVAATGHSSFQFEKKREGAPDNLADFVLSNPDLRESLIDYIQQKFWSQYGWGELFDLNANKKLVKAINRKIERLVAGFENKAAEELNSMPEIKLAIKRRKKK